MIPEGTGGMTGASFAKFAAGVGGGGGAGDGDVDTEGSNLDCRGAVASGTAASLCKLSIFSL